MSKDLFEYYNELDDNETPGFVPIDTRQARISRERVNKKLEGEEQSFIDSQDSSRATFEFTYKAARFETWWLLESLNDFYEHQWIADVLRRVKGGKEASVYQCRGGAAVKAPLVAAKVYRPRSLRNLRNDHVYRQGRPELDDNGRVIFDDGKLHAIQKKTAYGRELQHQSWVAHEYTSMRQLHVAGADVPEPYHMANNAILMEFIGGPMSAAPALNEVNLDHAEAKKLFDRVLMNISILLQQDRIHGDLSAYNILYKDGRITLIDFPQVISPKSNHKAFKIFSRDVERVCSYFHQQGVHSDHARLAEELWTSRSHSLPRLAPEEEE